MLLEISCIVLTRGGISARITLDPAADPSVTATIGGKLVWSYIRKDWQPWRLSEADVDGDGSQDFLVAMHKLSRHADFRFNTIFVFGFDGTKIYPKWRGSSMGRDFTDYVLLGGHKDRLALLDRRLDGQPGLSCYEWNGFGFKKLWEKGPWSSASLVQNKAGRVQVQTDKGLLTFTREGILCKS
jgi:hypothetical protein